MKYHKIKIPTLATPTEIGFEQPTSTVPAVGKWHLGTYVVDCFPKFSLNFIQGIGQVDGEILETLWSTTNKVAGTTQAMGKSHQSEVWMIICMTLTGRSGWELVSLSPGI